jgi:competence protein ComEA
MGFTGGEETVMKRFVRGFAALVLVLFVLTAGGLLAQGKVDINSADVEELMSLRGVGETRAQAIVTYRQTNGPFQSLDDLKNVPGIGDKIIQDNRSMIAFGKGDGGKMSGAPSKTMTDGQKANTGKSGKGMTGTTEKTKQGAASSSKQAMPKGDSDTQSTEKKASSK